MKQAGWPRSMPASSILLGKGHLSGCGRGDWQSPCPVEPAVTANIQGQRRATLPIDEVEAARCIDRQSGAIGGPGDAGLVFRDRCQSFRLPASHVEHIDL